MLPAGHQLGPYEILQPLGAGGMGEVYRARDLRLGREVAVKVVLSGATAQPARLERFEQEARRAAALSHPNVLTVHDVGHDKGQPYVVFELLEGETLGARLERGPLPYRRAIEVAIEICRGLGAAHDRGLVHRDLKPDNLFITRDGRVKILDFGLARLRGDEDTERPARDMENLPEPARGAARQADDEAQTTDGEVLGTLGYLAPEQVGWLGADERSDIFALGAVIYEMLSGRRAFTGATPAETLSAIQHADPPPLGASPQVLPPSAVRIVRRCLAKEPEARFRSAHDLGLALESLLDLDEARPGIEDPEPPNPYPGLASFGERDAERFFGREIAVRLVWRRLKAQRLLGLIGPSGAGKTSFVRAGVVASRPPGWGAVVTHPAASPFVMLGQTLAPALSADPEALRQLVQFEDPEVAYQVVVRWKALHGHALLVVDQFEELFTLTPSEEQVRFADLLGRLSGEGGLHVLLAIRDDFLMRCEEHASLAPVFTEITPLGPMTGSALRRAVEEPARQEGFAFEEGLVETILSEVEGERGALPLLAFAVSRLWEARDTERRLLNHEAYAEIGGVSGALARHAETTLEGIGADRLEIVRELFRNLVTAEGTRATRDRDELLSIFEDRERAAEVLQRLLDARLLTSFEVSGLDDSNGSARGVEVIHESLLSRWPRLVEWQARDAHGARFRDQLRQAARVWDEKKRSPDVLWSGTAYREFSLWRERYGGRLTALEGEFAEAMVGRARKRKHRWQMTMAGLLAASLGVTALLAASWRQEALAYSRAEASRLAALGRLELAIDPTAALAYARSSLLMHDSAEARRLAVEALWSGPVARVLTLPEDLSCSDVAASPDGEWIACGAWSGEGREGPARLSNDPRPVFRAKLALPSAPGSTRLPRPGAAQAFAWGIHGSALMPAANGRGLEVWWARVTGWQIGPRAARAENGSPSPGAAIDGVLQDRDVSGRRLVSRGHSLFILPAGERGRRVATHPSPVRFAGFHRPSASIVSVDESRMIRVWSDPDLELRHERRALDSRIFTFPTLDPSGRWLAWHSLSDRAVALWDLEGPPDAAPLLLRRRNVSGDLGEAVFLGERPWLASAAREVAFWPLDQPWLRVIAGNQSALLEVAFSPDSRRLVSCGAEGARVWPMVAGDGRPRAIPYERPYSCNGLAFDRSGERVLVAAPTVGGVLGNVEGGPGETLVSISPGESIRAAALDPAGRWAAVAAVLSRDVRDRRLHLLDRRSHETRDHPLPGATSDSPESGGVYALRFVRDGRLLSVGDTGLLSWDPSTGESRTLHRAGCGTLDASADGSRVAVGCLQPGGGAGPGQRVSEVFVLDVDDGTRTSIRSHGDAVQAVALDASGTVLATGDTSGIVRVGSVVGSEPHLLLGAPGVVTSVDISPDSRWVAASVATQIWLWPMPELSRPPLHIEPLDTLVARIDSLTNVRLEPDSSSLVGYLVKAGPFPGWATSPEW